ncbi:hypothetical protein N7497_010399 [Penicillium chrysogenum]|nr:hypothetical protein N7497_010399 [Penicillium chrysogenum]
MSSSTVPYPFHFDSLAETTTGSTEGKTADLTLTLKNHMPAATTAFPPVSLRKQDSQSFSSRVMPSPVPYGLPDTGYIAMAEMCDKIRDAVRQVSVPVMADGDTGYGSPMNVKRTVESFASAGAAGVMIEDQQWPKRCGHTKGKSVVSRGEAFARIQAACDARNEGKDIFILARTDALIHGWEEAMARAQEFKRLGVDAIFVEALPDAEAMKRCAEEIDIPVFGNIIEGGKTENLSAKDLAGLGYSAVAYPWTLVAAHLKGVRSALDGLKQSMLVGAPPMILTYDQVCEGVGFNKYWDREDKYKFDA